MRIRTEHLLLLVATCVSLLVLEASLQVLRPPLTGGVATRYTPKAKIYGWTLPPEARLVFVNPDTGEQSLFRINSAGWKDVEHELEKPAGTYRILFVGDSYTYGYSSLEDLYARQVERILRQRGYENVEVLSMGVGSWGTDHALEVLRHEGLDYDPDLVVYQFCSNDVTDILQPDPEANMDPIHWNKPFKYELHGDELVRVKRNPRHKYKQAGEETVRYPIDWELSRVDRIQRFLKRSALIYNLDVAFDRLLAWRESSPPVQPAVPANGMASRHPMYVPGSPYFHGTTREESKELDHAFRLFERLLLEMRTRVEASGARFAVFAVNSHWDRELGRICSEYGIELLEPPQGGFETYETDGHFNAVGNREAARYIARFLKKKGWIEE